ncbi:glycosyltransferase [Cellulomonas sp. Sa3CUA2]|uniref:Glycosyltransferase n=1 Tax=Cellulomonas avistercoris TaxID=2762242 RepID=A0ABR8Q9V9_9CELL|nr:glycosyltransferase [Cellulomonas avistercoris]MBD7917213.1 glycosyltransferase [Cellulomonas avistercoris]
MTPERTLAVVVVNYNSAGLVSNLHRSLAATRGTFRMYVVNNSPSEDLDAWLSSLPVARNVSTVVVEPGRNLGFGAGCNEGIRCAQRDGHRYAWLLNPDAEVMELDFPQFWRDVDSARDAVLWATRVQAGDSVRDGVSHLSLWTGRVRPRPGPRTVSFANGNSVVVHIDRFTKIGGFASDYFLYFEEPDVSMRLNGRSTVVPVLTSAAIRHDGGGSTGSRRGSSRSATTALHANRSAIIFFRRWLPWRLPIALVARTGLTVLRLPRSPHLAIAGARGLLAGCRSTLSPRQSHDRQAVG